jgi:hypothetical protein
MIWVRLNCSHYYYMRINFLSVILFWFIKLSCPCVCFLIGGVYARGNFFISIGVAMFIKTINPGDWSSLCDQGIVNVVPISTVSGFGINDSRAFMRKTAASEQFIHDLRNIKLGEGDIPVHVNAIGASEYYGCFAAGAMLLLADGQYAAIETIRKDLCVVSAEGYIRKVVEVFKRDAESTLKITAWGLADPLVCTDMHPFKVLRREYVSGDREGSIKLEKASACTLRRGDFLIWTPPGDCEGVAASREAGYSLGKRLAYCSDDNIDDASDCYFSYVPLNANLYAGNVREAVVAGYVDGMGDAVDTSKPGEVSIPVLTYQAALGIQRLFWSLGKFARLSKAAGDNPEYKYVLTLDTLAERDSTLDLCVDKWRTEYGDISPDAAPFQLNGRMCIPIVKVETAGPATVYNVGVEVDHTYSCFNVDTWNSNRKGDAFSEQTCKDWHHTFVTEGKNYVHHQNREPDKNFGKVASSCYNDKMHRVELLIVSNGNEAAAKRNKGLVLPDEFLSKLEKNAEVPVSMGCYIKHDVCSICGNEARTRAEYCDDTTCKDPKTGEYFFGCREGLGKVASDGRKQFVDNVDPHFFDISYVGVPADRGGYGFRVDYMDKTASALPVSTPLSCLGLSGNDYRHAGYMDEMRACLYKLSDYEKQCTNDVLEKSNAYSLLNLPSDVSLGVKLADATPAQRLRGLSDLAHAGVILSPDAFARAFGLDKSAAIDIEQNSRGVFRDLYGRSFLSSGNGYADLLIAMDALSNVKTAAWMFPFFTSDELSRYAVSSASISNSVMRGVIKHAGMPPTSGCLPMGFAETYGLYKAASLCRFPIELRDYGVRYSVWQSFIPDLGVRVSL